MIILGIWFILIFYFILNFYQTLKNQNYRSCYYLLIILLFEFSVLAGYNAFTGLYYLLTLPSYFLIILMLSNLLIVWWEESCITKLTLSKAQQAYTTGLYNSIKGKGTKTGTDVAFQFITPEYLFSLSALLWVFIILTDSNTAWTIYLYMELSSIIILSLFGWGLNSSTVKGLIWYFFISFTSSLFLAWGFYFSYRVSSLLKYTPDSWFSGILTTNPPLRSVVLLSAVLLIIAFLIKLGIFPQHVWVIHVYNSLNKNNLLISLTLISVGYWYSFINMLAYINNLISTPLTQGTLLILLAGLAVLTTLVGSLVLYTQLRFKGFLAGNSIITAGFLTLICLSIINTTPTVNVVFLGWFMFLYLACYLSSTFIIYVSWSSLIIYSRYCYTAGVVKVGSKRLGIKEALLSLSLWRFYQMLYFKLWKLFPKVADEYTFKLASLIWYSKLNREQYRRLLGDYYLILKKVQGDNYTAYNLFYKLVSLRSKLMFITPNIYAYIVIEQARYLKQKLFAQTVNELYINNYFSKLYIFSIRTSLNRHSAVGFSIYGQYVADSLFYKRRVHKRVYQYLLYSTLLTLYNHYLYALKYLWKQVWFLHTLIFNLNHFFLRVLALIATKRGVLLQRGPRQRLVQALTVKKRFLWAVKYPYLGLLSSLQPLITRHYADYLLYPYILILLGFPTFFAVYY